MRYAPTVGDFLNGVHIGKVHFVIPPGHAQAQDILYDVPEGRDHPTIAAAVAASKAGQNDRVVVNAHYDHDGAGYIEQLAAAKDAVKFIGMNLPLLDHTDDCVAISGDGVVIAGFRIKPATGKSGVIIDGCDHWVIRDNKILCEAHAAASYGIEVGNTTAANYGLIQGNQIDKGLTGIWFEIANDMVIRNNILTQTSVASAINIEETVADGTALRNFIVDNFLMTHATTSVGIKLANDTAYSHFVSRNVIIGAATPITQDKWDEGLGTDNIIYANAAVPTTVDPASA
jgi:hypothetical protein